MSISVMIRNATTHDFSETAELFTYVSVIKPPNIGMLEGHELYCRNLFISIFDTRLLPDGRTALTIKSILWVWSYAEVLNLLRHLIQLSPNFTGDQKV